MRSLRRRRGVKTPHEREPQTLRLVAKIACLLSRIRLDTFISFLREKHMMEILGRFELGAEKTGGGGKPA